MTWLDLRNTGTAVACSLLLLLPVGPAFGVVLGDAELGSSMNQPLRAWIPYGLTEGESIDASCVRLLPGPPLPTANVPVTVNARLSLQSRAGNDYIAVESTEAINNRIVRLIIEVKCGKSKAVTQEYMLLLYQQEPSATPDAPRPGSVVAASKPAASAIAKRQPPVPTVSAPQPPAKPRIESPPVKPKGGATPAAPNPPQASAAPPNPPPRQIDKAPPLPRIEPARGEAKPDAGGDGNFCCFKLSYELTNREGPPLTDAERERLRQDLRDRTSEQDPVVRVRALNEEVATLNKQLAASAQALEAAQARAVRSYATYAAFAAALLVLALGAWLWLRQRTRNNLRAPANLELNISGGEAASAELPVHAQPVSASVPAMPEGPGPRIETVVSTPPAPQTPSPASTNDAAIPEASTQRDHDLTQADPDQTLALRAAKFDAPQAEPEPDAALRAAEYKNAYILARFPEIATGNIVLDDQASVIEGARIFYQDDQDAAKAAEFLRIAISTHPEHVGCWLALFEILWLERAAPEFSEHAQRYHDRPDGRDDTHWPMIAKLGRDLEPGNELYRADGLPAVGESSPNWLNAELDMMGDVLGLELRTQVLALHDAARAATGHGHG